jgi:hypothetical protein
MPQTPANLIVTRDFIDLVESKARIQSSEFVGITGVKAPAVPVSSSKQQWHQLGPLHTYCWGR